MLGATDWGTGKVSKDGGRRYGLGTETVANLRDRRDGGGATDWGTVDGLN